MGRAGLKNIVCTSRITSVNVVMERKVTLKQPPQPQVTLEKFPLNSTKKRMKFNTSVPKSPGNSKKLCGVLIHITDFILEFIQVIQFLKLSKVVNHYIHSNLFGGFRNAKFGVPIRMLKKNGGVIKFPPKKLPYVRYFIIPLKKYWSLNLSVDVNSFDKILQFFPNLEKFEVIGKLAKNPLQSSTLSTIQSAKITCLYLGVICFNENLRTSIQLKRIYESFSNLRKFAVVLSEDYLTPREHMKPFDLTEKVMKDLKITKRDELYTLKNTNTKIKSLKITAVSNAFFQLNYVENISSLHELRMENVYYIENKNFHSFKYLKYLDLMITPTCQMSLTKDFAINLQNLRSLSIKINGDYYQRCFRSDERSNNEIVIDINFLEYCPGLHCLDLSIYFHFINDMSTKTSKIFNNICYANLCCQWFIFQHARSGKHYEYTYCDVCEGYHFFCSNCHGCVTCDYFECKKYDYDDVEDEFGSTPEEWKCVVCNHNLCQSDQCAVTCYDKNCSSMYRTCLKCFEGNLDNKCVMCDKITQRLCSNVCSLCKSTYCSHRYTLKGDNKFQKCINEYEKQCGFRCCFCWNTFCFKCRAITICTNVGNCSKKYVQPYSRYWNYFICYECSDLWKHHRKPLQSGNGTDNPGRRILNPNVLLSSCRCMDPYIMQLVSDNPKKKKPPANSKFPTLLKQKKKRLQCNPRMTVVQKNMDSEVPIAIGRNEPLSLPKLNLQQNIPIGTQKNNSNGVKEPSKKEEFMQQKKEKNVSEKNDKGIIENKERKK